MAARFFDTSSFMPLGYSRPAGRGSQSDLFFWLLVTCFSGGIFLFDYLIQSTPVFIVLYILVCVFTIHVSIKRALILYVTVLCSFLLFLGAAFHPEISQNPIRILDRVFIDIIIWTVAWLGLAQAAYARENAFLEKRFQMLFESVPNSLVLVGPDGKIMLANAQTTRMFGYVESDLVGRPIETILPVKCQAGGEAFWGLTARELAKGGDLKGLKADGKEFPVEVGWSPLTFRYKTYVLVSVTDITDRKRIDAIKDHFSGVVAHELRTPLAVASIIMANFCDGLEGELNDDQKQLLVMAKENLDNLNEIINNLLMLTLFDRGQYKVKIVKVDLLEPLKKMARALERLAHSRGLEFSTDFPPSLPKILADVALIKEVIYNLYANAMKYANKRISLKAGMMKSTSGEDQVYVTLKDDGSGIPKENLERIFDSFHHSGKSRPSELTGGLGLGLSLSRDMIRIQKGEIWVESGTGEGCQFYFTLPIASDADGQEKDPVPSGQINAAEDAARSTEIGSK